MIEPGLYVGAVMHRRARPRKHRLNYRAFWLVLDLDEAETATRGLRLLSLERFNLFSFSGRDHADGRGGSLRDKIASLAIRGGFAADGPIRLMAMPRVFGYVFNPLSVYFCHDARCRLSAIVWEVSNTFGGRHSYVIGVDYPDAKVVRQRCRKELHVSPFIDMDIEYRFRVVQGPEALSIAIGDYDQDGLLMSAALTARRRPLTDRALVAAFARMPFAPMKVVAAIYWEALLLWLKGVRYRQQPAGRGKPIAIHSASAHPAVCRGTTSVEAQGGRAFFISLNQSGRAGVKTAERASGATFIALSRRAPGSNGMTYAESPQAAVTREARRAASHDWDPRARVLGRLIRGLRCGRLTVALPSGAKRVQVGAEPGPEASLVLHRWRALRRILTGGDIGFAQAWIDGDVSSPDPVSLIRLAARNVRSLGPAARSSFAFRLAFRLRHHMNANTRRGSARNVVAHYDLGNDFFAAWLDPSMFYSSALWADETPTLEAAQQRKLNRIYELLDIKGGERILEIGCGWGALAVHLAKAGAAHVTGLTLSPSQLEFARNLVLSRGLASSVELRLQDYRAVEGRFDRIVSIEMVEAVGEAWWPAHFDKLADCLAPGGRAVLQVITIAEDRFEEYRRNVDFIQRYIFPGGCLPSKAVLFAQFERAGLRLVSDEYFGRSYARTLAEWRRRFLGAWPKLAAEPFDERFRRLWDYYLCYCEAGFLEGVTDVGLYCLERA